MNKSREKKGFTLIEILVAMSIFALILVAMMAVFNSALGAYQKGRAVKKVMEDSQFALNSIAKDVRMGRIESSFTVNAVTKTNDGTIKDYFAVTRNRNQEVACYHATSAYLGVTTGTPGSIGPPVVYASCPSDNGTNYKKIVDLAGTRMSFDLAGFSGFYSCPSEVSNALAACPAGSTGKRRGWVEINLNIAMTAGQEMDADSINVQTIVSSRDYGWEDVN